MSQQVVDGFLATPGQDVPTTGLTPRVQPGFADNENVPSLASLLLETARSMAQRSAALGKQAAAAASSAEAAKPKPPPPPQQQQQQQQAPAFATVANPEALLSSRQSSEYLASLLSMPLPALQALPNSLSTLSSSLDTDLASLAFTRYSSFLLAHSAAQSMSSSFTTLSDSLDGFIESTDALRSVVASFEQRVAEPKRKRERMALVRERMEEVEELLDAPSIVDACVRAGHWPEAIDVALRLAELHARMVKSAQLADASSQGQGQGALGLLTRVKDEVSLALLSLRARVLESLVHRNLKLPGAVRAIGILRRINERGLGAIVGGGARDELDEDSLRVVFLAARWQCLQGELEGVEAQMVASGIRLSESEPAQQTASDVSIVAEENEERTRSTKRWIEVWREVVGETIGMYTELFLSSTARQSSRATALPASSPLALFLSTALGSLSDTFAATVPCITSPSSLSSLLTQLSYCSHSFARHGLEFREVQQLRERVEVRVGRIVAAEWEQAGRKWEKEWRDGWEGGAKGSTAAASRRIQLLGGRAPISDWLVVPEGLSQVFATPIPPPPVDLLDSSMSTWHHQPPPALALLPPLARFLNAHATALNSLRLLPPLYLYSQLLVVQARELDRATQVLAAFTDAWLSSSAAHPVSPQIGSELSSEERIVQQIRDDERQLITFAIAAFGRWVVPWCEGGLKVGVYGEVTGQEDAAQLFKVGRERQDGVVNAVKRVEMLLARIEGRSVEDVDTSSPPSQSQMPSTMAERGMTESETMTDASPSHPHDGGVDAEVTRLSANEASSTAPAVDPSAAIEDLPVEDMPLSNPPKDIETAQEVEATTEATEPEVAIVVEGDEHVPDGDEEVDAGWGLGQDVAGAAEDPEETV